MSSDRDASVSEQATSRATNRPTKRRFTRISLRALLCIVALFAVACPFLFPPMRTVSATATLLPSPTESPQASRVHFETQLQLIQSPFLLNRALQLVPNQALPKAIRDKPNAARWLQQRLDVSLDAKQNATITIVSSRGTEPQLRRLADAIARAYQSDVFDYEFRQQATNIPAGVTP